MATFNDSAAPGIGMRTASVARLLADRRQAGTFISEQPCNRAAQVERKKRLRRVEACGDDLSRVAPQRIGEIALFPDAQPEMGTLPRAQHFRAPRLGAAGREQHVRRTSGPGCAQQRAEVAAVLHRIEHQTIAGGRRHGSLRYVDHGEQAGRRIARAQLVEQCITEDDRLARLSGDQTGDFHLIDGTMCEQRQARQKACVEAASIQVNAVDQRRAFSSRRARDEVASLRNCLNCGLSRDWMCFIRPSADGRSWQRRS
jgi:hypothetical protein